MSGHTRWSARVELDTETEWERFRVEILDDVETLDAYEAAVAANRQWAECSVTVIAHVDIDGNDARIGAVIDALLADRRAVGTASLATPGDSLSSTFQVFVPTGDEPLERAVARARLIFDDAISTAGIDARTTGVSVVEGGDPDRLP